jgi:hypothetical protein
MAGAYLSAKVKVFSHPINKEGKKNNNTSIRDRTMAINNKFVGTRIGGFCWLSLMKAK